jgi:hypothetical protein
MCKVRFEHSEATERGRRRTLLRTCLRSLESINLCRARRVLQEHTEHAESERSLACAARACASYVYVMRRRSYIVRQVVDMLSAIVPFLCLGCSCKISTSYTSMSVRRRGCCAHKYRSCGWSRLAYSGMLLYPSHRTRNRTQAIN